MEIELYDDGEAEPSAVLWAQWRDAERKLAEQEGREPVGWYWTEGMPGPAPLDFTEEDPHE